MRPGTVVLFIACTIPVAATAQVLTPWGDPAPRAISLAVFRPAFDGGGTTALSTVNQLGLRWSHGARVYVLEIPFVVAKADGAVSGATFVGNPFIGIASSPTANATVEAGVRLPIAKADNAAAGFAQQVGFFGDVLDFEAYGDHIASVRGSVAFRDSTSDHIVVRLALRPTLVIPTGNTSATSELYFDYAVQAGYETDHLRIGAALNGRALITESNIDIGARTLHQGSLGAGVVLGRWRPGVEVRVPLDQDLKDLLDLSVGMKLEVTF